MKKIFLFMILLCCLLTACGSSDIKHNKTNNREQASERPYVEVMSQEDFLQVTNDVIEFATEIGSVFTKMAELSCKYADTINSSNTFDWSQYWDFRENKEEAIGVCDKILSYNDSNCSKDYQLCIDECKSLAYQISYFFNTVSKEMNIHELDTLTQNLQNDINVGMNYAMIYQTMATISFLEGNNGDPSTIANLRQQLAGNYIFEVTTGSKGNGSSTNNTIFTNSYGTPNTKCVFSGCTNAIATSGDTNCCVVHSNKCFNCGKYIDGDAMFCMDCLSGKTTSLEDTGKYTSSNVPKSGCQYTYFDGSGCGKSTNKYASLCDAHFKELNDTYQSLIGE